jgi:hypothetical protein
LVNDIDALIGWLLEAPRGRCPVEDCGATALISAISRTEVTAVMHSRGPKELTVSEQQHLQAPGARTGHQRRGTLYAGSVPAAAVTAVLLPSRIPRTALRALGTDADGTAIGDDGVPLGRALAGLGVRREPLEVLATPGQRDAAGREQVIWSAARLWLDHPVALVTECFYQAFLDTYPAPWTLPHHRSRTAP